MKRILNILLVILLSFSLLIGCSSDKLIEQESDTSINNTQANRFNKYGSENVLGFTNLDEDLINTDNVMDIIKELSSKKYKGRLVGTEGNELAVKYMVDYFKEIGLENPKGIKDYKQYFPQSVKITNNVAALQIIDKNGSVITEYEYLKDFNPVINNNLSLSGSIEGKMYYINDAGQINKNNEKIKDKILVISKETVDKIGISNFLKQISHSDMDIKGAIIERNFMPLSPHPINNKTLSNKPICAYFNPQKFNDIAEKAKIQATVRLSIDYLCRKLEVPNVIGVIQGTDKDLKDEYIIICGHLDHLGDNKNGTYNPGALDNASGAACVMEIARILNINKVKPKKTIIFIGFNGEEEGLFGSRHYVNNPLYPLENTIVINLDMVGSKRKVPLYISTANKNGNNLRDELYKYAGYLGINSKKHFSQASDHAPFCYSDIESVLLIHLDKESGYHTPRDTIENIDKDRIKEVIKLVLYYLDKKAY